MDKNNFLNFGKYDLTINKVFYRNMILMAIFMGIGISAFGFLGRWLTYNSEQTLVEATGVTIDPLNFSHYSSTPITQVFLGIVIGYLPLIFAGCAFHNFRKKQGRIMELTLPATNMEKYLWHILVSVGGGLLLTVASLLAADLLNIILHLIVYGTDHTYSLTARMLNLIMLNIPELEMAQNAADIPAMEFMAALRWCMIGGTIMNICAYVYGNSVKYHYNIIITYCILVAVSIFCMVGFGGLFSWAYGDTVKEAQQITPGDVEANVEMSYYIIDKICLWLKCFSAIMVGLGGICVWRSYKRYCNAQITTSTNK